MPSLTELLGRDVVDATGAVSAVWLISQSIWARSSLRSLRMLVRKGRRGPLRELAWVVVADLGPPVRLRPGAKPVVARAEGRGELLLAAHVLDRQIFDARGMRLRRVGDVDLSAADGRLCVGAVEVGIATLLRRVGFGRLTRGIRAEVVDWPELHLVSGPGHGLQLRSGVAGVHRLSAEQLAALAARLPVERAGQVLGAAEPARADAARVLVPRFLHRRRRGPLHLRRRAPA